MLSALVMGTALAGPVDLVGFGSPGAARVGGGVALPDGAQTVFLNPAMLPDLDGSQLSVGFALLRGQMRPMPAVWWDTNRDGQIDDLDPALEVQVDPDPADAVSVALGRSIGSRFGLAFAATLPVRRLLRIQTFEPSLPVYPMLTNTAQRFDMALGFGWEQLPGLSVGGAVQVIARARFSLTTTLDLQVRGAAEGDTGVETLISELSLDPHVMTVDIVPALAPMVALHWEVGELAPALDGLALGGTWRASTGVPVDVEVDLQANVQVEELGELDPLGLTLLAPLRLVIYDHYLPEQWTFGVAWRAPERFAVFLDGRHTRFAPMRLSVAQVVDSEVRSQLFGEESVPVGDGNPAGGELRNTTSVRGGGELHLPRWEPGGGVGWLQGVVRLAAGYEPAALASQGEGTSLLDADRLLLGGGLGVAHGDPFELVDGPVRWDLHVQAQVLGQGELAVDTTPYRPGAPVDGGSLPIGGTLWTAGVQTSIDY